MESRARRKPREKKSECFYFLPIPVTTLSHAIQWKLDCRNRKQKRKNKPITRPRIEHWLWLVYSSTSASNFDDVVDSLYHTWQSHKWNRCSAAESAGLILTPWHGSSLLMTTPSLAKTSLSWSGISGIVPWIKLYLNRSFQKNRMPKFHKFSLCRVHANCFSLLSDSHLLKTRKKHHSKCEKPWTT